MKTREELHLVMTAPPPPPAYEPVNYHVHEGPQEEGTELSAELSSEGILDDRNEEKRVTEAEKNERVQRQLMVRAEGRGPGGGRRGRLMALTRVRWSRPRAASPTSACSGS